MELLVRKDQEEISNRLQKQNSKSESKFAGVGPQQGPNNGKIHQNLGGSNQVNFNPITLEKSIISSDFKVNVSNMRKYGIAQPSIFSQENIETITAGRNNTLNNRSQNQARTQENTTNKNTIKTNRQVQFQKTEATLDMSQNADLSLHPSFFLTGNDNTAHGLNHNALTFNFERKGLQNSSQHSPSKKFRTQTRGGRSHNQSKTSLFQDQIKLKQLRKKQIEEYTKKNQNRTSQLNNFKNWALGGGQGPEAANRREAHPLMDFGNDEMFSKQANHTFNQTQSVFVNFNRQHIKTNQGLGKIIHPTKSVSNSYNFYSRLPSRDPQLMTMGNIQDRNILYEQNADETISFKRNNFLPNLEKYPQTAKNEQENFKQNGKHGTDIQVTIDSAYRKIKQKNNQTLSKAIEINIPAKEQVLSANCIESVSPTIQSMIDNGEYNETSYIMQNMSVYRDSRTTLENNSVLLNESANNPNFKQFYIGSKNVQLPVESVQSLEAKYKRVTSMAHNLNMIKSNLRIQYNEKQTNQLMRRRLPPGQTPQSNSGNKLHQFRQSQNSLNDYGQQTYKSMSINKSVTDSGSNKASKQKIANYIKNAGFDPERLFDDFQIHNHQMNIPIGRVPISEQMQNRRSITADSNAANAQRHQQGKQIDKKKIKEITALMDTITQERQMQIENEKLNKQKFIDCIKPDISYIMAQVNQKKQEMQSRVKKENKEIVKIEITKDKFEFKKSFRDSDIILQVIEKDKSLAQKVQNANPETKKFLNSIFKDIQAHEDVYNSFRRFLMNSDLISKSNMQSEHEKIIGKLEPIKRKKSMRNSVLKFMNVHKFEDIILEKVAKEKKYDFLFICIVKQFQNALLKLVKDPNIGCKYDNLNDNIWTNEYLVRIQKDYQKKGLDISHMIQPSCSRNFNKNDVDCFFNKEVQKKQFYSQAKQGKIGFENDIKCDQDQQSMLLNYYYNLNQKMEVPLPAFAKINNNTLYLSEIRITDGQGQSIKQLLEDARDIQEFWVKNLIINECCITDKIFSYILQGIISQEGKITNLIYTNNNLGSLSIPLLKVIIPQLQDLKISNLKNILSQQNIRDLSDAITNFGSNLMRLNLSNINLNDSQVVDNICDSIKRVGILSNIDLSWTCLSAKNLLRISESLNAQPAVIRNLNLSYNSLQFDDETNSEYAISCQFLDNFSKYIVTSDILNHLDISGMGFRKRQLMRLSQSIVQSQSLIAVHLNDNGLYNDMEAKLDILDIFGINKSTFNVKFPDHKVNQMINEPDELRRYVTTYLSNLRKQDVLGAPNKRLNTQTYKEHLLKTKQLQQIGNQKQINLAKVSTGVGRQRSSVVDSFIVTRKLNFPELIFNEFPDVDLFFQAESSQKWDHSQKNECYVCQKWQYTAIMYQQGDDAKNEGLTEITDKQFLLNVHEKLKLQLKHSFTISPFICGSVINGGYSRKLRMLRSDLFALLSLSNSGKFIGDKKTSNAIKKGVTKIAQVSQKINQEDILCKIGYWNKILHHKLNENYLTDVCNVNQPPHLATDTPLDGLSFIYARFLPPGHHNFIIYDPMTKRAFCKDVIVHLNQMDLYPEFPRLLNQGRIKKPRQNIWRKWIDLTVEDQKLAYTNDQTSGKFEPDLVIKDQVQLLKLHELFKQNFNTMSILYYEMLGESPKYPFIDCQTFEQFTLTKDTEKLIQKSQIDICFQKATRTQNTTGIKGALNRSELFDALARLVHSVYPNKEGECIQEFLEVFVQPWVDKSLIIKHRKQIRNSQVLNKIIFHNSELIERIFNEHATSKGISLHDACSLIKSTFSDGEEPMNLEEIRKCFVFSKMLMVNDSKNHSCLNYMQLVEFQEFLCRVGLCLNTKDTVMVDTKFMDILKAVCSAKIAMGRSEEYYTPTMPDQDTDDEEEEEVKKNARLLRTQSVEQPEILEGYQAM